MDNKIEVMKKFLERRQNHGGVVFNLEMSHAVSSFSSFSWWFLIIDDGVKHIKL